MRRLGWLSLASAAAVLIGGCSGGASSPSLPAGAARTSAKASESTPFAHIRHTPPLPPPIRHRVTAADRERARAGGWQPVTSQGPFAGGAGTELLMTDGTVMVSDTCMSSWYSLSPDQNGNYVNGTWTKKASLPSGYAPLYFASAVLPDGKLIINGGEYNFCKTAETTLGAIYDPVANTWTPVSPPSGWPRIGDAQSTVLANGTYMLGNCCTGVQALFDEATMSWTQTGPGNGKQDANSEEGWTLLRNGDVLTVDISHTPYAEAYAPAANTWSSAGQLPVNLIAASEIGAQTLLPNDSVFVAGATGHTALYAEKSGMWTQGPDFPVVSSQQLDVADGPSVLLTNGTVMIPASPGIYHAPSYFFIFNGKKLAAIAAPPNAVNDSSYDIRLLLLPSGQVLETDGSGDVEVYSANVKPETKIAPVVTSVATTLTHGSTYKIVGKRFNGFSQAEGYGDDDQQATNYPLVRIVNNATGHVFYARTHGHSFMGVGSSRSVSTMFDVPSAIETGASSLVVVANGIASAPVSVTVQ
jgi:hypothetical protein